MIKFYYHPSPNPAKVALLLEEAGLEYELVPVDKHSAIRVPDAGQSRPSV